MPPAPLPDNEAARLAALMQCHILDTASDPAFDGLTRMAAECCDAPIALVSLVASERQWFKSRFGLDVSETPRGEAFCGYAILGDAPLIIQDATKDERTADNPLVTGDPGIRFYAGVPLALRSGERLGTLCVIDTRPRDLTPQQLSHLTTLAAQASSQLDLRRTVADLEKVTETARSASSAKSIFLANMSHEIRTPMTAILGYAGLLEGEDGYSDDPQRMEYAVRSIQRNAAHLMTIINDILDLTRIESGRLSVAPTSASPRDIVAEAAAVIRPQATHKGLTLTIDYATPTPTTITTDPTRLRQILLNLLSNAVKFTSKGGVAVRISCAPDEERITFEVTDTGIGMSEETCDAIRQFEPFTQATDVSTGPSKGAGLGLPISAGLASMLGGELTVTSTLGRGSVMTVVVSTGPLAGVSMEASSDSPPLVAEPAPEAPSATSELLRQCRILLVEDGVDNQRLISFYLRKAGADVAIAENGRRACEMVLDPGVWATYDVILMDMQMPEMDGYDASIKLRSHGVVTPIIALTARAMDGDEEKCRAMGCDAYLTKPVDRDLLIRTCRDTLDRRRTMDGWTSREGDRCA